MSIAAAENAGLGPCDLPDPWVPHTTQTSGVCSLPLSSPAAATAAVAVSTGVAAAGSLGGGNYHSPTVTLPTTNNNSATASNNNNNNNTTTNNNNKNLNINNPLILQQKAATAALTAANYHQHSPQAKIMNAVASPISANSATSNRKIRRKTDSKPQSQINKCNNEKRRREMENNYIEQLGEFLQLNKRGDMTSTKPDKAAILNQVVKTYRDICDKGQSRDISSSSASTTTSSSSTSGASPSLTTPSTTSANPTSVGSNRCARCATDNCTIHPVQQGEVSSTEPPLPEPPLNGQAPEISAYFEAIEFYISSVGWVLLQINSDGCIETCTQNVRDLFGYEKSELHKQPIYSYLHSADHAKLNPILNTMSYGHNNSNNNIGGGSNSSNSLVLGWNDQDDTQTQTQQGQQKGKRSISTKVRMLVKDRANDAMDQKGCVRGEKYEEVVLIAAPVKDDGDDSSSLLCLITRPEDESPLEMNIQQHVVQRSIEQLTFKLDVHGKILLTDTSALRDSFADYISKCHGSLITDLCHIQDLHNLKSHLKDVQDSGGNTSSSFTSRPFRLRLGSPDVYMHVKANSRLFLNSTPGETDYIMSWQTFLSTGDDMNSNNSAAATSMVSSMVSSLCPSSIDSSSSSSQAMMPSTSHHHTTTTNVGGPLMTSVINGGGQVQASPRIVTAFSNSPSGPENSTTAYYMHDQFDFDFNQHSSFDMDGTWGGDSRPNSRTSVATPVSTPRPPSVQAFSPAAHGVCQSPSTPYQLSSQHSVASQPSPQQNNNNNNTSMNNNNGSYHGFVFHNFDDKDSLAKDHHLLHNNNGNASNNNNNNSSNVPNNGNSGGNPGGSSGSGNSTDSERLRHLLTLKPNQSVSGQSVGMHGAGMVGDETENENHILKGLLNSDEDKDNIAAGGGLFKMNATNNLGRMYANAPKQANPNNRMLLSLLNEKNEDDDSQSKARPSSELMRQLQKDDGPKDHHHHLNHQNSNNMSSDDLKRFLKIQLEEPGKRKRPSNEPDDGKSAKRPDDKPSKLRDNNRMLASLLEKSTKMPVPTMSLGVKIIPDITSSSVNRVSSSSTLSGLQMKAPPTNTANVVTQQQQQSAVASAAAAAAAAAAASNSHGNPTSGRGNLRKQPSDTYLTQQQQQAAQQQQQQHQDQTKNSSLQSPSATTSIQRPQSSSGGTGAAAYQMDHHVSPFGSATSSTSSLSAAAAAASVALSSFSGSISLVTSAPSSAAMVGTSVGGGGVTISTNSQMHAMQHHQQQQHQNSEVDPELANILNYVIDCVPDCNMLEQAFGNTTHVLSQQEINEKIAINEIQKSLMQVEAAALAFNSRPPPPYSQQQGVGANGPTGMTQQQQQQLQSLQANQGFQHPPPMYQPSRNVRVQYPNVNIAIVPRSQRERLIQFQQKERLLQQQQKQHLLVPESATARGDQLCLNPGLNNIGSLLNNSVAPNVSLSRNNMPPDSQLSPSFAQSMIQQQLSPGQRGAPFSPQANAGYQPQFTNNGQRMSPQQQQQLSQVQQQQQQQQQQMAFQNVGNNSGAQLSPRLAPFNVNAQSVATGAGGVTPQQWNASAAAANGGGNANSRISLQQHNPMLSAQLQGVSPYRQFQTQRRPLNSPGAGGIQRQNSFPTTPDGFPGPASPSPQSPYASPGNVFNSQQLQRIQRQTSVPQATQHLPGSPRSFGGSDGTGGGGGGYGMMYNSMQQHAGQGPPPTDFYGRTQTAGNGSNSEYVRQELRAVVSGRAQQQTTATGNNGVPGGGVGGGGGGGGGSGGSGSGAGGNGAGGSAGVGVGVGVGVNATSNAGASGGLRTPQSPLGMGQGPMVGANSTNPLGMSQTTQQQGGMTVQQQQQQQQLTGNSLLNTPPDQLNFNFDIPAQHDFFGNSATR